SPPRTITGTPAASTVSSPDRQLRAEPRIRTTTRSDPSSRAGSSVDTSRRDGLPSTQSAPLDRADSRSVSDVDNKVRRVTTQPENTGVQPCSVSKTLVDLTCRGRSPG